MSLGRLSKILVFLAGCLLGGASALAAEVEAKKDGVEVLDSAGKGGNILKTLKKGDALPSMNRQGMYWEVQVDGKVGFVSVLSVNRKVDENAGLAKAIRSAVKDGREGDENSNARARSAVMGVRGLDESDDTAFAGNAKPNLRLVYSMEDHSVGSDKISELGDDVLKEVEKKAKAKGIAP